ncbi:hypothetical protein Ddc_00362 [Ditylenchus destructor]|nr:hypothetical protein Ddc_00362 [Ditylenchus destructor]
MEPFMRQGLVELFDSVADVAKTEKRILALLERNELMFSNIYEHIGRLSQEIQKQANNGAQIQPTVVSKVEPTVVAKQENNLIAGLGSRHSGTKLKIEKQASNVVQVKPTVVTKVETSVLAPPENNLLGGFGSRRSALKSDIDKQANNAAQIQPTVVSKVEPTVVSKVEPTLVAQPENNLIGGFGSRRCTTKLENEKQAKPAVVVHNGTLENNLVGGFGSRRKMAPAIQQKPSDFASSDCNTIRQPPTSVRGRGGKRIDSNGFHVSR